MENVHYRSKTGDLKTAKAVVASVWEKFKLTLLAIALDG